MARAKRHYIPGQVWHLTQSPENDASWAVARNSFYQTLLTNSSDSYVATFTALGR